VIGSLLAAGYRSHLVVSGLPAAVANKARDSFAVGIHLGGPTAEHARSAFISGMHVAVLVGAGAALVAAAVVVRLLGSRHRALPADGTTPERDEVDADRMVALPR
jgi:hypothetical protein